MGWETIYITSRSKLSYKSNHLLVQTVADIQEIPFHHIGCIVIATTQAVITGYLVEKLTQADIKVIFCDSDHNPCAELNGYYSNNNRNQNIEKQFSWPIPKKELLWTSIVTNKIENQINVLKQYNLDTTAIIQEFNQIKDNDKTNREAVIAMKYFPALFGSNFSRGNKEDNINKMLNYGYTILLSSVNQEIIAQGYLTQLGIHHHSNQNDFNLSSDLMEPFRQFVDQIVVEHKDSDFDLETKLDILAVLEKQISYNDKNYILKNAINQHVQNCFKFLDSQKLSVAKVDFKNEV
ncbi:type II CRISPR-associated endonuclease Cas1 [Companilactobacillus allii]|uniref:CRISPR-associated endonuclease Cas1 n=1 Tax=Companilactobacillus allii TaxID=1847728 RepID=A0A1P8Q112_9LACO|nr:type II CRISPR-associated endonuclease Cas1 [Companilactobacillus allii]APX71564.1 subtype II CRISPR-associated endonuclease Cas1 [Companilactobacillus allii]USQ68647.1 type II CRISPR-associated endonuclease Cas1 [Companilactobacillus allii]